MTVDPLIFHPGLVCSLHIGNYVVVVSNSASARRPVEQEPTYTGPPVYTHGSLSFVGRIHQLTQEHIYVVRHSDLFDKSTKETFKPTDQRIAPLTTFPGCTMEEIVEVPNEIVKIVTADIIGFAFVFSEVQLSTYDILWAAGVNGTFLLRYQYCPHISSTSPFHEMSNGEPFPSMEDRRYICGARSVWSGITEVAETIQRALNKSRASQGDYRTVLDRTRFHNELAWMYITRFCKANGMKTTSAKLSYNKTLHLPGFVSKKVRTVRIAEVLTFANEDEIDTFINLFGWMSIYGVRGPRPTIAMENGRRITATHTINVVHVGSERFGGQRIVLAYDHFSLRAEVTYMKVQLRRSATGGIADTGNPQLNNALHFFSLPITRVVAGIVAASGVTEQSVESPDANNEVVDIKVGDFFNFGSSIYCVDAINTCTRDLSAKVRQPRSKRGLIQNFSLDDPVVADAVAKFAN
jgi:hypothetical protein